MHMQTSLAHTTFHVTSGANPIECEQCTVSWRIPTATTERLGSVHNKCVTVSKEQDLTPLCVRCFASSHHLIAAKQLNCMQHA